ncbi:invasion associated locus B family protein [Methylobacterium sp. AMS5]|uniref:invasion associated locus B family protein n=1 Tax=Methylobacterium sp. AMS5 TaxID=925818 RepID=UPI00074F9038|nr:invasion associated locus B family protein [Methylobacterium sp. AMS5]AMB44415.1 invasion protein [Methylobacterium sp. AMS5]
MKLLPLFSRAVVPLDREAHRTRHLAQPQRFGFARGSHLVPSAGFLSLCRPAAVAAVLAGGALFLGSALAQPTSGKPPAAPAAPPPVPSEPGVTTASYGDWVLRCQRLGPPEKTVRLCEVSQGMQVQGQPAPIAQVAIGRVPGETELRMTALLPVAVSFPSTVRVGLDERDVKASMPDLAWRRCLPGGCLADGAVKEEVLKRWREAEAPGRLLFKDAGGQEMALPLSFRGLGPALDALGKER